MGIAAPPVSNIGWGVLPLYWRALSSMNAISVLAYRLVATLAAMVALLVAFSVLATAIPLAMFSYGAQHSHYLTVSFIQYLNPLIQFCVAVLLLHEPMRAQGYAAFMVIWVAIAVYSFGAIRAYWGAAEAPRTLSASLTPLPEGSCRRRRLRGGRHGKQQKPRSRPKPQTPLTKQACTSSP